MGSINQSKSFTAGGHRGSLPWEVTAGVYRGSSPREFTMGRSMIWLAVVGTLNQSNAITMMSLLWWGALTNQNHSPREFTTGGYRGSLPQEVTAGVYRGRSPLEFTMGGSMIWLAVVGTLNQSNVIIMMSLLWWGALTNQNHSPREFTMGGHHGSLPREVTAGVYHVRSLQEFTVGGSMIWLAVVGTLNQSNAITMMSLLWWGALTNQNHSLWEFTVGGHCNHWFSG